MDTGIPYNILYGILLFITAPIIAATLAKITKDEKKLIHFYHPKIIATLIIMSIILYFINLEYALATTYMVIVFAVWYYITKR